MSWPTRGGSAAKIVNVAASRNIDPLTDDNAILQNTSGSLVVLTIPPGIALPGGFSFAQFGAGGITVNPGAGVTSSNIGQTIGPGSFGTVVQQQGSNNYAIQNPQPNTLIGSSGIPFIVYASGSWSAAANGIIDFTTVAQTSAWPYAYIYMPANSITASNVAGWYYGVFQSTTRIRFYNNRYNPATDGVPRIPASPTPFTVAAGANTTQDPLPVQGPTFTLLASSLGLNGALQCSLQLQANNSAGSKIAQIGFGASIYNFATITTSPVLGELDVVVQNLAKVDRQMVRTKTASGTGTAPTILTQDTSANTTFSINLNPGTTAGDFLVLHYLRANFTYGA